MPYKPTWPQDDYIIGNPPFLGDKRMRNELGDAYVESLRLLYEGRVPGGADLATYWFQKARTCVELEHSKRVGLLATQGIRGGANREVLKRIKSSGDIFFAYSDRKWLLEGAAVRISMIAFDNGEEQNRFLDDQAVRENQCKSVSGSESNDGTIIIGNEKILGGHVF